MTQRGQFRMAFDTQSYAYVFALHRTSRGDLRGERYSFANAAEFFDSLPDRVVPTIRHFIDKVPIFYACGRGAFDAVDALSQNRGGA
jgi:hypothetical protein